MYTNTIKVLVTSSRQHKKEVVVTFFRYNWAHLKWAQGKVCVDARMTSLGKFCIAAPSPLRLLQCQNLVVTLPLSCLQTVKVNTENSEEEEYVPQERQPSEANKNNGGEHAESLARRDTAGLHDGLAVAQGVKSVTTTMAVGLTCYHWSGDRHRNGGSRVKRGLYLPAWIVLRMAIPGVLLLLQGIPSTIFMAR